MALKRFGQRPLYTLKKKKLLQSPKELLFMHGISYFFFVLEMKTEKLKCYVKDTHNKPITY